MAYVIAHEVGHHVQNELGITQQLDKIRQQVSEKNTINIVFDWNYKRII